MDFDVLQPRSRGTVQPEVGPTNAGLVAYADGVNWNPGLGAGYYVWTGSAWIKLLNQSDASQPFWNKLVTGSAVISVTTNGEVALDGNAHGGYEFEFNLVNPVASPPANIVYAFVFNNDTTETNYKASYVYVGNGTALTGGYSNSNKNTTVPAQTRLDVNGRIMLNPSGYVTMTWHYQRTSGSLLLLGSMEYIVQVANLTRFDLVADTTGGIGVNSRFRLWRKK